MKIVSFGDVHMATRNLERMGEVMRDTDLVIISGDLTNFGGAADARKVIEDVRRVCPNVLALPGSWKSGSSHAVTISVSMPKTDGNEYMGCSPTTDFVWFAE